MQLNEEHREYLVALRDSGVTNMWGAAVYLERDFGMTRREASDVLLQWIKSFDKK